MNFGDGIKLVHRNLIRRKGRTILTALGVAIGTAAIVAMIALALGLKNNAVKSLENFQDITTIQVFQGYNQNQPGQEPKELNKQTVAQIKGIRGISGILASLEIYSDMELGMGRKTGYATMVGVEVKDAQSYPFKFAQGRFLKSRNEAVVSYQVPESLQDKKRLSRKNQTGNMDMGMRASGEAQRVEMLNKNVSITIRKMDDQQNISQKEYKFKVVGVLSQDEGRGETAIYIPIETAREIEKWTGQNNGGNRGGNSKDRYSTVKVKAASRDEVEVVVAEIKKLGYEAWSPAESLKEINKLFMIIQLILGGIGAISLLVASIGIMNTMFMSILERTKEIGIMKVIGAGIPDIRRLFLMESGFIGFIGGISGLGIAYGVTAIINAIARAKAAGEMMVGGQMLNLAIIPIWLALFAVGFAVVVGVIAGLLPAYRAARISPLQAIRQE
ncbi:MAG TPA: ABC transporter permease [Syntrophomonas sp.]|nr:ABC transporter permease [Syntrophomonas sp.]